METLGILGYLLVFQLLYRVMTKKIRFTDGRTRKSHGNLVSRDAFLQFYQSVRGSKETSTKRVEDAFNLFVNQL